MLFFKSARQEIIHFHSHKWNTSWKCYFVFENPFDDSKIQPDTVDKIISSMDTECDKQCTKALLISTSSVSNDTAYAYGMNPQSAKRQINRIKNVADECENATTAAEFTTGGKN